MSFNDFSPELLMEVFSRLLDVGSKIRLERVNKRFRDCIRNVESWKNNTLLRMKIGSPMSEEELLSFLKHTKVITTFYVGGPELSSKHIASLSMFSDKLKVVRFSYQMLGAKCPKYDPLLASWLGKFANTLEMADIACCRHSECSTLATLSALLPSCSKLKKLYLGLVNEVEGNNTSLLSSVSNLSLESIGLADFKSTINGEDLAAVCNSTKDHALNSIIIERRLGVHHAFVRFQLALFCHSLEPGAARGIKSFTLKYVDCEWVELLPTLPAVFPNLTRVELTDGPGNATAEHAVKMAKALGAFLHASAQCQHPMTLTITIVCKEGERAFAKWLWDSIDLIEVWRSGTKRTADMEHWKRTLSHGNVTASVNVE